jgi:uncharacterized membrane protein YkvA (DUF1232 family)
MGISRKEAEERLKRDTEKVTEGDVQKVIDKSEEIRQKFEAGGPLGRFIKDARLMLSVVKDYWIGSYREIPWFSLAAIVAALLYVFSPIDIIPDVLPVVGQIDDALVVSACLLLVEHDLLTYESWKIKQAI